MYPIRWSFVPERLAQVLDDEEFTQVKVLMALANDELTVGKNLVAMVEWIDITENRDTSGSPSGTWTVDAQGQGTIFNANKEIVLIAPRRNDVYVLDMSSLTPNGAFLGLPSLVYSKDKPCSACEKGKHHTASFKTKQNFSIKKCLHLLHMDLFGPVSPMSINHEKYTLVIVDEYSRYTWVFFLRKKSQAPEMIMSFIRMVENQNDVKVKQIRTDNGTEFRNHELESFCDEKGISQNFSSPYTPKQNGVADRKDKTLIEATRTMLNGSVLSKHFWTKAVRIAYYTQNRSIIVKRHDKTPYEIFRERIPDINYFHMFGCPVFIHNHKDHLVEETYHVTFDESMEAIRFTNTSQDEIGIDDSSRYPPAEYLHEDDPYRHYQVDSDVSYYVIPHRRSLTELTQENHVPEVIALNEPDIPLTEDNEGMLTRSMAAKLTAASTSECLFAYFLSEIEPKKVSEALKHPGWVDAMQEELNRFYRNKVWTLVPLPYGKKAIGSKWVFRNKKDEHVARMEAIGIFLAFATYMNFKVYQMDVKSAFQNVNETSYRGMIGSQMYLTATRPDIQFSIVLCVRYQSNPKESHLTVVKRILKYLKGTPTFGLYYPKCLGFDLKGYSNSDYVGCNMDRKSTSAEAEYVAAAGCCASILWMKSQLSNYDTITSWDHILKGDIKLHFIPTEYQLADIFTKPLDEPTFTRLKVKLGMLNID
ncbi:retrovirus-related pol polyprotein from transposon TNT 1-94 [Tanacetum coccineum]